MKKEKIIICSLVAVIVILISYICIDKMYLNKEDANKPVENNKQETNDIEEENNSLETVQIDSQLVKKSMESFNSIFIKDENLYEKNTYDISSITNYELVATAVNHVEGKYIEECGSPKKANDNVTYEMLNKYLNNYVLNKKIDENLINSLEKEFPEDKEYNFYEIGKGLNISNNTINITEGCHGADIEEYVDTKMVKAEKESNNLYVYTKQAFVLDELGAEETYYYKDYAKKQLIEKQMHNEENSEILNWDLYNTYKYTFKIVDGTYYFQKLELV